MARDLLLLSHCQQAKCLIQSMPKADSVAVGCRWYYAKGINTDEAYVFVCYDSRTDRARFTPHTGFVDPTTREDAPPRRSVESRAYVFWENETA